jgi:hypothetical protein
MRRSIHARLGLILVCGCNGGGGKIRCDGTCTEDDGGCLPVGLWFEISNMYQGAMRVLDTYGGAPPNRAFLDDPISSGGNWNFTPVGKYQRLFQYLTPNRSLKARPDAAGLFMGDTGNVDAQLWSIGALGGGWFRFTNKLLGRGRSMDTAPDNKDIPYLAPTGNRSGQFWKFKKID